MHSNNIIIVPYFWRKNIFRFKINKKKIIKNFTSILIKNKINLEFYFTWNWNFYFIKNNIR